MESPPEAACDDTVWAMCPHCGQSIDLWIDAGGAAQQRYIEDCSVCCRPLDVAVSSGHDGHHQVTLRRLDE